jgi:futalosine hydrolase
MFLIVAATEYEMKPFLANCGSLEFKHLLSGVGPLETAVRLNMWLHEHGKDIMAVINFGVAGAYKLKGRSGPGLLDVCLADREILGDLGICLQDRIERLAGRDLRMPDSFVMNSDLLCRAEEILLAERIAVYTGTFVTVNCVSGTAERGEILARQHEGICENMEGAAVARVCIEYDLPCLEIRCISNMVEERDTHRWQLKKACEGAAQAAAHIVRQLAIPPAEDAEGGV